MTIIAAVDGSALGNPGPAGWAWYVDEDHWAAGGWAHGTNNMGELMSLLDLLEQTTHTDEPLHVYCDSRYVINTVTEWMPGWKKRGWRKRDGKPVQNVELVRALDTAIAGRRVELEWVKGHSGHALNEEADRLANAAAVAYSAGSVPAPGPGWHGGGNEAPDPGTSASPDAGVDPASVRADGQQDLFSGGPEDEVTRVVELERALLTDEVRADPAAVAAMLHPGWTEVGASGRWWTRAELLERIAPLPSPTTVEILATHRPAADIVLLVWRSANEEQTALRSSWWVRAAGDWQQYFHQGTLES